MDRTIPSETWESFGRRTLAIPAWLRNPAGVAVIAAFVIGFAGLFTLAIEIGRPFTGYVSYGFVGRPLVMLAQETPVWFPDWQEAGLRHGDELLTINGLPYPQHVWAETAEAYAAGSTVEVLFYRPLTERVYRANVTPRLFTVNDFLDLKFPEMVVWAVFWMLAVIVLRARPDSLVNQVFATATALIGFHRLTAITSVVMGDELLQNLPKIVHLVVAGLIPPLIFHMAYLFPVPLKRKPVWSLRVLYFTGLLSGVTLAATRAPFWARLPVDLNAALDQASYQVMMILLLAAIVTLFGRLIWSRFRGTLSSSPGRRRMRVVTNIVLAGLIMALPPIITVMAPGFPGFGQRLSPFWEGLDLRYLLLAIPISFALAIIRYHTFQSPTPLFIFVLVVSTSALLAAIGVAVWSAVLPGGVSSPGSPHLQALFFAILIAGLFWSRQTDWRGWFGRLLHRDDRNYASARA